MTPNKNDDRTIDLLKEVAETFWKEDQATREIQVRKWRRLKLLWEGFTRTWYSEVAHDWRIWDPSQSNDDGQQDYYDKPVNVFRAYLESIIAALSITVPAIKCYPDDADNPLDLLTARAGDKIAKLIYRHNDVNLLWLQALFIYCTEGMVACHNYPRADKEYGTVKEKQAVDDSETHEVTICSVCNARLADIKLSDEARYEFNPDEDDVDIQALLQADDELCPECYSMMSPQTIREHIVVSRIIGETEKPKSRVKAEVFGGLYVKVANYARTQKDTPYLFLSQEFHYAQVRSEYPNLRDCIQPGEGNAIEPYERWARLNPQYLGQYPDNTVTVRKGWLRPCSFEVLQDEEDVKYLKKKFPNGAKVVLVNTHLAEYCNEDLDDNWTLTQNPLSDYLSFDPIGLMLTSIQEITNDLISLTMQTIEHGIPQTFADPAVLDFKAYGDQETSPGAIYPATPKSGKGMNDSFYEVRTATLSQEVLPFGQQIQSLGQMVVGAQPSLFGGDLQGSKTASQYSMSRAQALQRLQNTWKMFTTWWKQIFGKAIPIYIDNLLDDEKFVERDSTGNFINVVIHRAELEGKLGQIELEANENLPISFAQQKDVLMQLLQASNPQLMQLLANPENLPLVYEALGIPELYVPGEDSRTKQYEEIKILLATEPIEAPPSPEEIMAAQDGMPMQPQEMPSVEVGEFDVDAVELEICVKWLNSEEGRQAKSENPKGYENVLLHARMHKQAMRMKMMEEMMTNPANVAPGAAPNEKPKETDKEAPITGDRDVKVN